MITSEQKSKYLTALRDGVDAVIVAGIDARKAQELEEQNAKLMYEKAKRMFVFFVYVEDEKVELSLSQAIFHVAEWNWGFYIVGLRAVEKSLKEQGEIV